MKRVTTLFVLCVLGLLAFGLVMLYSVSPMRDSLRYVARQLLAGGLGLAGATVLALLDYRRLRPFAWWLWALALVMLAAVLVPQIGYQANGARRWFRLAGFQFQPSDFAKLALLLVLAHYGAHWQRLMRSFWRGVMVPALVVGVTVVPLFLEPDWGTALLLAAVSGVVLLVAGVRWRYLLPPVVLAAGLVAVLLAINPVRSDRIYAWLHPEETKDGIGYQAWQARVALALGGDTGVGLRNSQQKRLVPEHRTDFIFAIIGEEFGWVGSVAVILAFVALFLSGLHVAAHAADPFGRLLGTGISFLLGLQAFINMAVVAGALPNKGLALPFVSYGGSNLLMMLVCGGVMVSIAREAAHPGEAGWSYPVVPEVPLTRLA